MNLKKTITIVISIFLLQNLTNKIPQTKAEVTDIGEIKKEEYPAGRNVVPIIEEKPLVISGGVEEIHDVSLDRCIRIALGNNPRILASMQDVFAADARVKEIWSSYFPQFSWQSAVSRIRQLQLSDVFRENLVYNYFLLGQISASQMLYDFGVTQNQATIRKLDKEGYKVMLAATVNDVVCDVKKAYFNLQYSLMAKKIAQDTVERYEAFYEQAKAFYKSGTSPKVDVTIAEVNLSDSKLMYIQAENAVNIAMAKLSNSMGLPYSSRYKISDNLRYTPCDLKLEEAIKIAQESRPEFKLADIRVEEARQNVKLMKKTYFPTLTIEGQYQIGGRHLTSNYGYNFGGYLNFPTINGYLIRNEVKEAKALYSKEEATSLNTKNNIYLEVQQAYYAMEENKNSIPVAFLGMKQAKENYNLSYGRYEVGVGNPVELKEAQSQYQDALLKYHNTLYHFNVSKAELEKYIGRNINDEQVALDLGEKHNKKPGLKNRKQ